MREDRLRVGGRQHRGTAPHTNESWSPTSLKAQNRRDDCSVNEHAARIASEGILHCPHVFKIAVPAGLHISSRPCGRRR